MAGPAPWLQASIAGLRKAGEDDFEPRVRAGSSIGWPNCYSGRTLADRVPSAILVTSDEAGNGHLTTRRPRVLIPG